MSRDIFDIEARITNTDDDAKEWSESQFPKEHYGNDILIYEGWGMRALLEQAFMAGKESKEQAKLYRAIERKALEIAANASTSPRDKFDISRISFKQGAALPSELLLLAIETLIPFSGKDGYAEVNKALEQIRTRLEGGSNE